MIRKGTYLLFMDLPEGAEVEVGALGDISLGPGTYCYVGSAMGGLDQRISRHLSGHKCIRWHIDRLTTMAVSMRAYESQVPECTLASVAVTSGCIPVAAGFGCSDCRCATHLFSVPEGCEACAVSASCAVPFRDQHMRPGCTCFARQSALRKPAVSIRSGDFCCILHLRSFMFCDHLCSPLYFIIIIKPALLV